MGSSSRGAPRTCVTTEADRGGRTLPAHRMVNETDIVELELKSKRFNLSVKKKEALKAEQPIQVRAVPVGCIKWDSCCPSTRSG